MKEEFTTRMRKATRELHALSDAMVNAKLLIALSDNSVWADGLLVFYEIFKFLENAMTNSKNDNLMTLYKCMEDNSLWRAEAFEKDLMYYLGKDWKKNYVVRSSVAKYIQHLEYLYENNPSLLMAYVYHLYMGLLSGGQILRKKRSLKEKFVKGGSESSNDSGGEAVTSFGDVNMRDLKNSLRREMNGIATYLSEEERELLVQESKQVFVLNNSIIQTVQGANKVVIRKMTYFVLSSVAVACLYLYVFR